MKTTSRCIPLGIFLMILLSCATTSTDVKSTWTAPDYSGTITKVLIIGVSHSRTNQIIYENYFADILKKHGVESVQSHTFFSSTVMPDKKAIAEAVKKSGADTILLSQLIDSKVVNIYVPQEVNPAYDDLNYYYSHSWEYFSTPGYNLTEREVVMQTNLFHAEDQKLFWTATSDTTTMGTSSDIIKSFVKAIVKRMHKEGLIR
ncbi:MAG: hypothetical protein A4E66_02347 [Syntrophus sp. PtaB.Bin001]|nr:MAG: hypothetical protein A4E66_02347 [Syntrophus sp. PtaB.Bin001]